MAGFNPAEPRTVTGQWTSGSGGSQQQQNQKNPKKKPKKKPAHHPAAKKPAHKPPAHRPAAHKPPPPHRGRQPAKTNDKKRQAMSRAELRSEAHNDRVKAAELETRAVGLRHQISQMQAKLSSLYRLRHGGSSKKPASGSRSTAAAAAGKPAASAAAASGKPGSAAAKKPSSSSSTASQIASTQASISGLRSKLKAVEGQIANLKAQAASLSAQAAKKAVEEPATMTADLLEKAATLTGAGELTFVSFPIEKTETTEDGDLVVYGKATDGSVDSDEQIVDPDFSAKAIQDWLNSGGNVRVQHNPQRDPAGVGMLAEAGPDGSQWVKSLVIEPVAKRLVSKGALRAYSVGIAKPVIVRDAVARGGRITGGQIVEISLVDRPANKNCGIQLVKAAGSDGHPEYVGKVFGADEVVAKAAGVSVDSLRDRVGIWPGNDGVVKSVTLELPEDVEVSFSPADLSKIIRHRRELAEKRELASGRVVDSGGRDVSDLGDEDFAGPDKTYPIKTRDDVSDAASLAHHADDPGAVRARIRSIAQRKFGMGDDDLPPSLKSEGTPTKIIVDGPGDKDHDGDGLFDADGDGDGAVAHLPSEKGEKCGLCKGSGKILEGNRKCPDCQGSGMAGGSADDDDSAEKGDGAPPCRLCKGSGKIREGHVTCPKCKGSGNMSTGDADAEKAAALKAQRKAEREAVREALLEGLVEKGSGPSPDSDTSGDDDDEDDDTDDDVGVHHSGEGMDEGLNAKGGMPPWLKKKPAGGEEDDDKDSGEEDSSDEDSDEDSDDEKATKGRKILPGGPKKKGKKRPKESPPPKSLAGSEKPVSADTKVTLDGKPTSYMKASKPTVGHGTKPVPEHREPDGPHVEAFEHDAGLPTVPDEMKTAKKHRALGVSSTMGALHDLTCPAFHPDAAQKSHPHSSLADLIDPGEWQRIAMDMAATAPITEALKAQELWDAAICLKTAEPEFIYDIKAEANKAFSDANPGPGQGLTPQSPFTPGRFSRPYLTTGHAAPSPGHSGPNSAPVPSGQISAAQYQRGYLSAGHAAESPSSHSVSGPFHSQSFGGAQTTPIVSSMKAGSSDMVTGPVGRPSASSRRFYTNAQRDNTKQAMKTMHDHIAETFPDLCPMGQHANSANPVPDAVKAEPAPAKKVKKAKRRVDITDLVTWLEKRVLKGELSLEDAREEILKAQAPADLPDPEMIEKAATAGSPGVSADLIKSAVIEAVEEATSDLLAEVKRLRKRVASLEDGPDPNVVAWKGVATAPPVAPPPPYAVQQASAVPAGMPSMTEIAERTQVMVMKELEDQFRYTTDPAQREAAWTAICKMRGLL